MKKLIVLLFLSLFVACGGDSSDGSDPVQSNPCKDVTCSGHGTCEMSDGKKTCVCDDGYHPEGLSCIPDPDNPCAGIDCGDHGTCNEGSCSCDTGYHVENNSCVPDGGDPCDGVACGDHGSCSEGSCICDSGYHLENGSCVVDQVDPCAGVNCGDHGSCSEGSCVCDTGYTNQNNSCVPEVIYSDRCKPLEAATGNIITVTPAQTGQLQSIVYNASEGDVIEFESGTYNLNGAYLWIKANNVTLRSKSGNPDDVIIDGNYKTTEIITGAASNITIAELTLKRAYTHPIHITGGSDASTTGNKIYRVKIVDPREQAIKINPSGGGKYFSDYGTVACTSMLLTDEGRPHINPTSGGCYTGGVDAHQARGWHIRDNHIEGFWCQSGLSEHAIHLWRGCRDTVVERNVMVNNARGVGFGLMNSGTARTFEDDLCGLGDTYVGHYGGIIKNNFIYANSAAIFGSGSGFDCGICLVSSCNTKVFHNTIASTGANFSSIEWRFAGSQNIEITNNFATHRLRKREDANATLTTNIENGDINLLKDVTNGDLHLKTTASTAINQGTDLGDQCSEDFDGENRDSQPDIGADEVN